MTSVYSSTGGFSYFLSVADQQPDSGMRSEKVSRIIQICEEDEFFDSYADMPLVCEKVSVVTQ